MITGGTGGIGKEAAIELAKMGATVIVTGRHRRRGATAVQEIKAAGDNKQVALLTADLADQSQVYSLADNVKAQYGRLDVLVNNVGVLTDKREQTVDGIETNLAVNHLAPFLLTHLLLDVLKAAPFARVINVTGGMPTMRPDLANLQAEKKFQGMETYSHTKAVMMVTAYEFAQRLEGTNVSLNVAYPGPANTSMTRGITAEMMPWYMRLLEPIFRIALRFASPARAARSSIYLASSPEVERISGKYYGSNSKVTDWPEAVFDAMLRQKIWERSLELTSLEQAQV